MLEIYYAFYNHIYTIKKVSDEYFVMKKKMYIQTRTIIRCADKNYLAEFVVGFFSATRWDPRKALIVNTIIYFFVQF